MNKVIMHPRARDAIGYQMKAHSGVATVYLYGLIGDTMFGDGISAKQFASDLKALGPVRSINLRVNSEGGDVFAAKAIYASLRDSPASIVVHVDGLAASAASYIAMAGEEIRISEGAFMMIHGARTFTGGTSADLRARADLLDKVDETIVATYAKRTRKAETDIRAMMEAETWFNSAEAIKHGFADLIVENVRAVACVKHPEGFKNVPRQLMPRRAAVRDYLNSKKEG